MPTMIQANAMPRSARRSDVAAGIDSPNKRALLDFSTMDQNGTLPYAWQQLRLPHFGAE